MLCGGTCDVLSSNSLPELFRLPALAEGDIPVASGVSPWSFVLEPRPKPPQGGDTFSAHDGIVQARSATLRGLDRFRAYRPPSIGQHPESRMR